MSSHINTQVIQGDDTGESALCPGSVALVFEDRLIGFIKNVNNCYLQWRDHTPLWALSNRNQSSRVTFVYSNRNQSSRVTSAPPILCPVPGFSNTTPIRFDKPTSTFLTSFTIRITPITFEQIDPFKKNLRNFDCQHSADGVNSSIIDASSNFLLYGLKSKPYCKSQVFNVF